jgi:hypothetical protein
LPQGPLTLSGDWSYTNRRLGATRGIFRRRPLLGTGRAMTFRFRSSIPGRWSHGVLEYRNAGMSRASPSRHSTTAILQHSNIQILCRQKSGSYSSVAP